MTNYNAATDPDSVPDPDVIDTVVRKVLKQYVLHDNSQLTRQKIVHGIYTQIPVGPAFQVICDSWNNGPEEISAQIICCDVYYNNQDGSLVHMEFQADRAMLTPEERLKIEALNEAKRQNPKAS